ncbi:peptidase B [Vibrio sp. JCM 19236]|nr:peptidase B [Vibrio sp. JCM 19236]
MSTMQVKLSTEQAAAHWGVNAILSFDGESATIHIGKGHDQGAIQKAGRKLDAQGIKQTSLVGEGWGLEEIWSFQQAIVTPRKTTSLSGKH